METMSSRPPSARTQVRLRPVIAQMPQYLPGGKLDSSAAAWQRKLSSNEMPFDPLPAVSAALLGEISTINRYPDLGVERLMRQLAAHAGLDPAWIATGTGSVAVLEQIIVTVCEADDEVIFAWRSFEAYPIVTLRAGARPVPVPLAADGTHNLPAMARSISEKTKVVLICTPNNPTGTIVRADDLHGFMKSIPQSILVIIDEAYLEFVTNNDAVEGGEFLAEYPNVILLRTFSKAHGLAGLRVGYALARPELAGAIRSVATPFGVSALAEAAACAALASGEEVRRRVGLIIGERDRVREELLRQGWRVPQAQGNFVWINDDDRIPPLIASCAQEGISLRY
ncbi:MAG: histidinol-phosphate transaminase, partial [Angustibacter sp.]